MSILIDILLAILTIYLALQSLLARRLSQSVFLFFAFGLALALAWVRLSAVDVAITEAAIASGFLGVLFLDALKDFSPWVSEKQGKTEVNKNTNPEKGHRLNLLPRIILVLGLGVFLLIALEAVWSAPQGGGLAGATEKLIPQSGVEHPVTAVLLNFRAYDTWLEIGVILLGLLAVFAVGGINIYRKPLMVSNDLLLKQVILFSTPILFLFGAFLLYFGKTGPGGAFQAAVLWGAIGILLHLGGKPVFSMIPRWVGQLLLTVGLILFLVLGFLFIAGGATLFEYPIKYAGVLILIIETFAAVSIAAALMAMFVNLNQMTEETNQIESTN